MICFSQFLDIFTPDVFHLHSDVYDGMEIYTNHLEN